MQPSHYLKCTEVRQHMDIYSMCTVALQRNESQIIKVNMSLSYGFVSQRYMGQCVRLSLSYELVKVT